MSPPPLSGADLSIEVRDASAAPLIRLFRHPGAAFGMPKPEHRLGRYDPPPGEKELFCVLYTASNIAAAAMECRILRADSQDRYTYTYSLASQYRVARFTHTSPALFIRMDATLRTKLGISEYSPGYLAHQQAAKALFEHYGRTFHGLSWDSFHRGQPGRDYGFWHHQTAVIGLVPLQLEADCPELLKDHDWIELLRANPAIELQPDSP